MTGLIKGLGKGILYVLGFPFLLAALVISSIVGLFIFFFQFFKLIVLFFSGRTLFTDLDEDIKAKAILNANANPGEQNNSNTNDSLSLYPQDSPVYHSNYYSPLEDQIKNETNTVEEPKIEQEPEVDSQNSQGGNNNEY